MNGDARRLRIQCAKIRQRLVKIQDLDSARCVVNADLDVRHVPDTTTALGRQIGTDLFDEHIVHGATQHVKELVSIRELDRLTFLDSFVCGVDQRRRLQIPFRPMLQKIPGDLAEIAIDMLVELAFRVLFAVANVS